MWGGFRGGLIGIRGFTGGIKRRLGGGGASGFFKGLKPVRWWAGTLCWRFSGRAILVTAGKGAEGKGRTRGTVRQQAYFDNSNIRSIRKA